MEHVWTSLQENNEMVTILKKRRKSTDLKIQRERTKVDIKKADQEHQNDVYMSVQQAQLDKSVDKELSAAAKIIEKEQIALLKKALSDQQALFMRMIEQERVIASLVLQKTREENEENIKKERETIDSFREEARAQVVELESVCSNLKGLTEKLIPMIEQHQSRGNMNVECLNCKHMMCMQPSYFRIAVDNYCRPNLAMTFKVFKLEELYPDLQKYDLRAELREFGIVGTSIEFDDFERALTYHGYILDAEVYYLNPAPDSEPATGLVKIDGRDDVTQMVVAHAEQGTKICLLYLVSTHEDQLPKDDSQERIPCDSYEEADETTSADRATE